MDAPNSSNFDFEKATATVGRHIQKYNVLIIMASMCLIVISNMHMAGQDKATKNLTLAAIAAVPFVSFALFIIPAIMQSAGTSKTFKEWTSDMAGMCMWFMQEFVWRYPVLMSVGAALVISPLIVSTVIACTKNDDGDKIGPKNMGILGGVLFIAFMGITSITVCPPDMDSLKYVLPPIFASVLLVYFVYVFSNSKRKDSTRLAMSISNIVVALVATIAVCMAQRFYGS